MAVREDEECAARQVLDVLLVAAAQKCFIGAHPNVPDSSSRTWGVAFHGQL